MVGINKTMTEIKSAIVECNDIDIEHDEMRIRVTPRPRTGAERQRLYSDKKKVVKKKVVKKKVVKKSKKKK